MNKQDLISKVKEITASGLPFMEGKEKVELKDGEIFNVKDYGYLNADGHDFVVVANDTEFAFGGSVVTEAFKKLDEQLMANDIEDLLIEGIPMKIAKKTSKSKRGYTACEFFPQ